MSYYNFNFWIQFSKLKSALTRLGYNVETVRIFLKEHFGYKSETEIVEDLGVKKSFLDAKLMYKDDEEDELARRFSILLPIIKGSNNSCWWKKNVYVLCESLAPEDSSVTVSAFEVRHRMKSVIEEMFGITDDRFRYIY